MNRNLASPRYLLDDNAQLLKSWDMYIDMHSGQNVGLGHYDLASTIYIKWEEDKTTYVVDMLYDGEFYWICKDETELFELLERIYIYKYLFFKMDEDGQPENGYVRTNQEVEEKFGHIWHNMHILPNPIY